MPSLPPSTHESVGWQESCEEEKWLREPAPNESVNGTKQIPDARAAAWAKMLSGIATNVPERETLKKSVYPSLGTDYSSHDRYVTILRHARSVSVPSSAMKSIDDSASGLQL